MSAEENVFVPPSHLKKGEWYEATTISGSNIVYKFKEIEGDKIFVNAYKYNSSAVLSENSGFFNHYNRLQRRLTKAEVIQKFPEAKHLLRKTMFHEAD